MKEDNTCQSCEGYNNEDTQKLKHRMMAGPVDSNLVIILCDFKKTIVTEDEARNCPYYKQRSKEIAGR